LFYDSRGWFYVWYSCFTTVVVGSLYGIVVLTTVVDGTMYGIVVFTTVVVGSMYGIVGFTTVVDGSMLGIVVSRQSWLVLCLV
jgi:hypothetical protein